jgi:ATP-dependent helicase/nuclease subunit A
MTRARERLVFSRTPPWRGGAERSWWQRIEGVATRWLPAAIAAQHAAPPLTPVIDLPLHMRALPAPALSSSADDATAARLGQAVHRVLEWAGAGAGHDLDHLAAAAALEFGGADPGAVRAIAQRILGSADCARFFDAGALAWAGNEVPVVGVGGQAGEVLRIDRLVCTAGPAPAWWVLDYKLVGRPQHNPLYRDQLAAYRDAVQALQPGETVRAAFINGQGELIELG